MNSVESAGGLAMYGGDDCPWYPTARLFKIPPGQPAAATIDAMIAEASALANAHASTRQ